MWDNEERLAPSSTSQAIASKLETLILDGVFRPGQLLPSERRLCERLGAAGKRMGAVHMGSAGSAFLVNHRGARWDGWTLSGFGEVTRDSTTSAYGLAARYDFADRSDVSFAVTDTTTDEEVHFTYTRRY